IFAAGARQVSPARADSVLAAARGAAARVGVFVEHTDDEIARAAHDAALDIVQLHGGVTAGRVRALRQRLALPVWAVVRVRDATSLAGVADGVLLDSFSEGRSGGTGTPFDWRLAAGAQRPRHALFIAAGGLDPDSV